MGPTEAIQPKPLDPSNVADCMALSAEAGWNQTAGDWSLFLKHGTVFGVADESGRPVATGAALPYPGGFAWISMVLVTTARRRERLGTSILETCIADLENRGLVPVLDATPAGEQVYRPLGFEPIFSLTRWQGQGRGTNVLHKGIRPMTRSDLPAVAATDALAFGANRAFLLESLFDRAPQYALVTEDARGFVLARPGRLATQIGPLVADDEQKAGALLDAALDCVSGPTLIDLADRGPSCLVRQLERRGFTIQRPFLRMARRRSDPFGDPRGLFAVAGPEFG
jgi:GNAT superfamily N-acetyltransferase